mmetsp:Transcript_48671/g.96368  ORF Transcript_48671/g.96368 Transcript_48671/m.96368 type:complete len:113 (+) Transcript_48671:227-565(+)
MPLKKPAREGDTVFAIKATDYYHNQLNGVKREATIVERKNIVEAAQTGAVGIRKKRGMANCCNLISGLLLNNPLGRCLGVATEASDFVYTLDFTESGSRENTVPDARVFPCK